MTIAYDWKSLKKGDLVVDVGGGIGSTTLRLAQAFPELRFVVQDRELNIPAGIKVSAFERKIVICGVGMTAITVFPGRIAGCAFIGSSQVPRYVPSVL